MSATTGRKRVVVWGTGFVGKLVIPEIVRQSLPRTSSAFGCNGARSW